MSRGKALVKVFLVISAHYAEIAHPFSCLGQLRLKYIPLTKDESHQRKSLIIIVKKTDTYLMTKINLGQTGSRREVEREIKHLNSSPGVFVISDGRDVWYTTKMKTWGKTLGHTCLV